MINWEDREEHPAFGLVGFSRISGGDKVFFGSDVPSDHYIQLSIYQANRRHDLGQDWIGPSGSLPIIEVDMSYHQFAELLTCMNVGSGVPCTIKYTNGKPVEPLTRRETQGDRIKKQFKERSQQKLVDLEDQMGDLKTVLGKERLNKDDKLKILTLVEGLIGDARSNSPFYLEQFEEATDKMVVQAKSEVDAFITHAIVKTGLETLKIKTNQIPGNEVKAIGPTE